MASPSTLVVVLAIAIAAALSTPSAHAIDVRSQLRALAARHEFDVVGIERIGDTPAMSMDGDLRQQLRGLLAGFNHVIVEDDAGRIEKVVITSARAAPNEAVGAHSIETEREGLQHFVKAWLEGPLGRRVEHLIVDTGASTMVLPLSMSEELGYKREDLIDGWGQTANGRVAAKLGLLRSVRVGGAIQKQVAVSFIDDDALGGNLLLGMSFLGRYRFTLDDANRRLLLFSR